jgi:ABC-type polysaccharide/polyol phosphate export permease
MFNKLIFTFSTYRKIALRVTAGIFLIPFFQEAGLMGSGMFHAMPALMPKWHAPWFLQPLPVPKTILYFYILSADILSVFLSSVLICDSLLQP